MPRLLIALLARQYMNADPGNDGAGTPPPPPPPAPPPAPAADDNPAALITEGHGKKYIPPPAPDPVVEVSDDVLKEFSITRDEFARLPEEEQRALVSTPEHEDTPWEELQAMSNRTPAPPAPPAPPPAPGAPTPPAPPAAPAQTPAAQTPAPQPPAPPAPAQQWRAITDDDVMPLPEVVVPPAPRAVVTKERLAERDTAQTAYDALEAKYEDGALTLEEFRAQRKPYAETIRAVGEDLAADGAAVRMHSAATDAVFGTLVNASLDEAKKLGLDYRDPANAPKLQELDAAVQRYARAAPLMNPGKTPAFYDRWALQKAHAEVGAKHGIQFTKPAATPGAPPPAPPPARRDPPDLQLLPPTTRGAPPAADSTVHQGEFAHLEGLTHDALEREVARMKPDQMERYLDR